MFINSRSFLLSYTLFHLSIAGYVLQDDYMQDFYNQFEFFTAPDPTNGFVQYVSESQALSSGMIHQNVSGTVQWSVDIRNPKQNTGGIPSIRLESKKSYNGGLIVLDVEHMPTGCGTWPAFWMVGPEWPKNGEIDILEGVNDQETNSFALHTSEGCSISQGGISGESFTGKISTPNCDVAAEGQGKNVGCAIKSNDPQSYGEGLNANKGGVFATEWTDEAISIYFFPRSAVPQDALSESPDPSNWGPPTARFAGGCDIPSFFKNNKIVFDTTFCGDWAGAQAVWGSGSCASKADTCEAYVKNNQSDFADAHWTVRGLKVYSETKGDTPPPSNVTVPTASPAIPSISEVFPGQSTFTTRVRSSVGSSGYVPVNSSAPTLKPQPPVATRQPQPPNPIRPSFSLETSLSPSAPVDSGSASPTLPVTTDTPANTAVPAPNPGGPLSGFKWPRPGF